MLCVKVIRCTECIFDGEGESCGLVLTLDFHYLYVWYGLHGANVCVMWHKYLGMERFIKEKQ